VTPLLALVVLGLAILAIVTTIARRERPTSQGPQSSHDRGGDVRIGQEERPFQRPTGDTSAWGKHSRERRPSLVWEARGPIDLTDEEIELRIALRAIVEEEGQ
jgi:hypothetical protein